MDHHILSFCLFIYGVMDLYVYLCMDFWLRWVFITACRPSVVVVGRGYTLTVVCLLPITVASLVAEHRL